MVSAFSIICFIRHWIVTLCHSIEGLRRGCGYTIAMAIRRMYGSYVVERDTYSNSRIKQSVATVWIGTLCQPQHGTLLDAVLPNVSCPHHDTPSPKAETCSSSSEFFLLSLRLVLNSAIFHPFLMTIFPSRTHGTRAMSFSWIQVASPPSSPPPHPYPFVPLSPTTVPLHPFAGKDLDRPIAIFPFFSRDLDSAARWAAGRPWVVLCFHSSVSIEAGEAGAWRRDGAELGGQRRRSDA